LDGNGKGKQEQWQANIVGGILLKNAEERSMGASAKNDSSKQSV